MQEPATAPPSTMTNPAMRAKRSRPKLTPGKVAIWLFLATEIMFFTGLIGSYIVLRAGSSPAAYSNLFPPGSLRAGEAETQGLEVTLGKAAPEAVAQVVQPYFGSLTSLSVDQVGERLGSGPLVTPGMSAETAAQVAAQLKALGASATVVPLRTSPWPRPYDEATNPLSIDLTALNTFILICSSVTMVLALSAIQRGQRWRCSLYLLATLLIGGTFLGIQVYEYRELLFERIFPIGISATGHFRPDVSLFASCFFTMTGFHGAHVAGGLVVIFVIWLRSVLGYYSRAHHAPIEMVGLYWHFVDLVWIILFTVVYLI